MGGVFALGTIGGPLIGGTIVDTSWLGWRWCFYVGVPFAVAALVVLQKTLHLPVARRQVKVDWPGAALVTAAVSLLLVWVSFAGDKYHWLSWQTAVMVGGSVVLGALFLLAESRASEPIVPLRLFRNRTISLAITASVLVGVAMYCGTTFLSQYFQLARDKSPTTAGLMTLPMILGLAIISILSGRTITRTGHWKNILVIGTLLTVAGVALMGTARATTAYWLVALYMFLIGAGLGMTMQNLVLAVQNQVRPQEMGAASAVVAFMRTLGGAVGVSALGTVTRTKVANYTTSGLARLGIHRAGTGNRLPKLSALPAPVRSVVEDAFGHGIADVFLWAAPFVLLAAVAVLFIREVPLRTSTGAVAGSAPEPEQAGSTVGATR
jgi:MFS family permease